MKSSIVGALLFAALMVPMPQELALAQSATAPETAQAVGQPRKPDSKDQSGVLYNGTYRPLEQSRPARRVLPVGCGSNRYWDGERCVEFRNAVSCAGI